MRDRLGEVQNAVREPRTERHPAHQADVADYFSEGHGVSVFAREGESVYLCYSSYTRGTEFLMGYFAILDRTPKGRDEGGPMGTWLRRHDEYDKGASKDCCS